MASLSPPFAPAHQTDPRAMRTAGRDLLSLALIDARNHTLHLLGELEQALAATPDPPAVPPAMAPPLWMAGHIGWFAEYWIGRNTQRGRGPLCPPAPTRLASIEPHADRWWQPQGEAAGAASAFAHVAELPDAAATRAWLLETLEGTLELLEKTPDDDDALYFYRLALFHEDQRGEQFVELAQAMGLALVVPVPTAVSPRPPILFPATCWQLGTPAGGFRFDNEAEPHAVAVPEFEIDAQAVTWAQYVEFVADGGYDRREHWCAEGWEWLQKQAGLDGRRGPRYVDEIGTASGAVLQQRFGQRVRLAGPQAASHVSWWEADAWARWAGRRLVTEVEWEIAAHAAPGRGFRWGDVHEWTAGTLQAWPGFVAGPWVDYSLPWFGRARVLRGASFATRARLRHPKWRGFALPSRDEHFSGFRTCAV